jgi:hypothetical protein
MEKYSEDVGMMSRGQKPNDNVNATQSHLKSGRVKLTLGTDSFFLYIDMLPP